MDGSPTAVVRASFEAYQHQDLDAARRLMAEDMTFTSPQDDHIDKETYFSRCFPTRDRLRGQQILRMAATGEDVFVMYEYELVAGGRYRNSELITVRDGRIVEVQVFFGGRQPDQPAPPLPL